MDFKVAGTRTGITALQMDIKIGGINAQIMAEALEQAKKGRLYILGAMEKTLAEPREQISAHAPRIIQIKGIELEAEFAPNMLYVTNQDKPGFIGALGTLLGNANVNIATFNLGRQAQGKDAICLLQIDDPVPDAVWEKVTKHFSQPEIAALLVDIAQINSWNRFNVAVRMMVGEKWEKAA